MKILVFEWLSAVEIGMNASFQTLENPKTQSMLRQGGGMLLALTHDLRRAGHEVVVVCASNSLEFEAPWSQALASLPPDSRCVLPPGCDWQSALVGMLPLFDSIWAIAPESEGCLMQLNQVLNAHPIHKLHPQGEFVQLTMSKSATLTHLAKHGIQPEFGQRLAPSELGQSLRYPKPMVLKLDDGAGSESIQFANAGAPINVPSQGTWRIEPWLTGLSISVSVIQGPNHTLILEPTVQRFDCQPAGNYIGGSFPLDDLMREHAHEIVSRAIQGLPMCQGYFGFDLLMNCPELNGQSLILEINPRLTCSYLGLRRIYQSNLAEAIVLLSLGQSIELSYERRPLAFDLSF